MGFQVNIDSMTYTPFGTNLDTWLNTDFINTDQSFCGSHAR